MDRAHHDLADTDQSYLAYRIPGTDKVKYCQIIEASTKSRLLNNCDFVMAPFDDQKHHIYYLKLREIDKEEWESYTITFNNNQNNATSEKEYQDSFIACKKEIDTASLEKIVLSRIKTYPTHSGTKPHEVFNKLLDLYPATFTYLLVHPDIGCWCGATPEILLTKHGTHYTTDAIAGTTAIKDESKPVEWQDNHIREQDYIRKFVSSKLDSLDVLYAETEVRAIKAGTMLHLASRFSFDAILDGYTIVKSLHPGPAISGYPVPEARRALRRIEQHDRAFYTGYCGPVDHKQNMQLFVNLRCMQVFQNQYCLYLGGGLVASSEMKSEWEETELKATTLLKAINEVHGDK